MNDFKFQPESAHWYNKDGTPAYTIIGKNGVERPPNVRDARKLSLAPGVTTVNNFKRNIQMENWKIGQGILASLTTERKPEETQDDFIKRLIEDSRDVSSKTAEIGNKWHEYVAINIDNILHEVTDRGFPKAWYENPPESAKLSHLDDFLKHNITGEVKKIESCFAHTVLLYGKPLTYGGRIDLITTDDTGTARVYDIKTKDTKPDEKIKVWDNEEKQLSAYRSGILFPAVHCFNIVISRNENRIELIEHSDENMNKAFQKFIAILNAFYVENEL